MGGGEEKGNGVCRRRRSASYMISNTRTALCAGTEHASSALDKETITNLRGAMLAMTANDSVAKIDMFED